MIKLNKKSSFKWCYFPGENQNKKMENEAGMWLAEHRSVFIYVSLNLRGQIALSQCFSLSFYINAKDGDSGKKQLHHKC